MCSSESSTTNFLSVCECMEKHFLPSPKFINKGRNFNENLLTLYLLCSTEKTKVNYKIKTRLRLIKRIFFINHEIILDC